MDRYTKELLNKYFSNKKDRSGKPYIGHLVRVSARLPDRLKTAGLLHDTLEDTNYPHKTFVRVYGSRIYNIVLGVTRCADETYYDFIRRSKNDPDSRLIKIADLKDNLRPIKLNLRSFSLKVKYFSSLIYLYNLIPFFIYKRLVILANYLKYLSKITH